MPGASTVASVDILTQVEHMRQMTAVSQAFVDPAAVAEGVPQNILGIPKDVDPLVWRLMSGNLSPEAHQIEYQRRLSASDVAGTPRDEVEYLLEMKHDVRESRPLQPQYVNLDRIEVY